MLPTSYSDFHGGLNTKSQPYLIADDESRDLANVQGTVGGAIVKRNGLATFATPSAAMGSLYAFEQASPMVLVGAVGTTLVAISNGGVITTIKTGLSTARWEFVTAPVVGGQGPLFAVNGIDAPQQWSGTGLTANWTSVSGAIPPPNGKYCIYAGNQVFVAGVPGAPSTVYWSAIADPTNWDPASITGAGSVQLDPNDGQAITAIAKVGPYVLVAKPRKLWVIIDTATASIRRLSDQVGCVSHRSMVSGAEGTYFLSEDRGVFLTNGTTLSPISDKITPTILGVQPGLQGQAAGAYFNGHYYLSLPLFSGVNDTTLDYDASLQSWWKHTFGSNQMTTWHPGQVPGLYSAKPNAAILDHCFAPNVLVDNGVPFQWVWRGPWQSPSFYRRRLFPTPYYRKRLRQMRFDGQGTVDFSLAKDFALSESLIRPNIFGTTLAGGNWGGSGLWADADGTLWGAGPTIQRTRQFSLGVANAFSVVFSATSTTPDMVTSYVLILKDRTDLISTA